MTILVTGGAGFVGSHTVDEFLEHDYDVVVLDNFSSGDRRNVPDNVRVYERDMNDTLDDVFESESITGVCLIAAKTNMRESLTDPMTDARVNVLGVLNVMNTATRYDVPNFIFASTGGALYGDTDQLPTPETVPPQPLSPYGITKMAGERYGYFFANSYDRNVTVLRYSNIYGPRLGRKAGVSSAVYRFLTAFENDERIEIRGDGEQSRDFVYVQDVARANRMALEQADGFNTYNVGSGTETSVNTLIETIASIYDTSAQPSYTPAIEGEVSRSALDVTKINRELGWEPTVSLQEGLQQTRGELS